jgi:YD repeat-containing protein
MNAVTVHDGDGNIVEQTVDNGDGTGTRTVYDADGNPETVEQLTGLPTPEPEPVDPLTTLLARLADARSLEEVRQAAQEATQP